MARINQTISLDPVLFEEFCKYAGRKGMKISTWIALRMQEFVDEEKAEETYKNRKTR